MALGQTFDLSYEYSRAKMKHKIIHVKQLGNGDVDNSDVIMTTMVSQITGVSIVYSTVSSGKDQRKHQSYASLVFVRGIHRSLVDSPYDGPVTQKLFSFDDVLMNHKKTKHITIVCILWYKLCIQVDYPIRRFR